MTKKRLIASLLVYNGSVVQTRKFKRTNIVGSAFTAVDFFNSWTVDEIILLEISYSRAFLERFIDIVYNLSRRCFVPLTVGGKIVDLETVKIYTRVGADKVVLNTAAVRTPDLVTAIAKQYGSQCVVVSIDGGLNPKMPTGYEAYIENGKAATGLDVLQLAREAVQRGAGEIMINSIEHDGTKAGYNLELTRIIADSVDVPVIAFGGAGKNQDFVDAIVQGHADAAAAGNIFHYTEHSTKKAKEYMAKSGIPVRYSSFYHVNMPRKPVYEPYLNKF